MKKTGYLWKAFKVGLVGAIIVGVFGAVLGSGYGIAGHGGASDGTFPLMIIGGIIGFLLFFSVCVTWFRR